MTRTIALAALAALVLAAPAAHAYGGSWRCKVQGDMDNDEARAISGDNGALYNIVLRHRERADIAVMRAQCEAFAAGEPYEISCLNDRRDWDAIKATIPSEYFGTSSPDLTPLLHQDPGNADAYRDVVRYCRGVGAIE